jgi:uncharacterized protein
MTSPWVLALIGAIMIGSGAALLLLVNGQIAGVSGLFGSLLRRSTNDRGWRLAFLGGFAAAGFVASRVAPEMIVTTPRSLTILVIAGLIVGYGTRLGNGCTAGHGVCGMGRLAPRSLVAGTIFISVGLLTVFFAGGVS